MAILTQDIYTYCYQRSLVVCLKYHPLCECVIPDTMSFSPRYYGLTGPLWAAFPAYTVYSS